MRSRSTVCGKPKELENFLAEKVGCPEASVVLEDLGEHPPRPVLGPTPAAVASSVWNRKVRLCRKRCL